jgi:hypothetical protein
MKAMSEEMKMQESATTADDNGLSLAVRVAADAAAEPTVSDDESKVSEDGLVAMGVKMQVGDSEAIAIAMTGEEDEGPMAEPSFFVEADDVRRIVVDVLCSKRDGKVLSVSRAGIGVDYGQFKYLRHTQEWFEFSVPSYEDMQNYRRNSSIYRQDSAQLVVDRMQLRNFFLVWHLKEWSLRDRKGAAVELKHEKSGAVTDASIKRVYAVHPTILDIVLTVFEKEILLG